VKVFHVPIFLFYVISSLLIVCGLGDLVALLSWFSSLGTFGDTILSTLKTLFRCVGSDAIVLTDSRKVDLEYGTNVSAEE
jgi:hypothetical protein